MSSQEIFGSTLAADPTIAVKPYVAPPDLQKPAPLHKLHYVIEIVGPRSMPAAQARPLLDKSWQDPLGGPAVYIMSSSDETWRALGPSDTSSSFDSLALTWPYLTEGGTLSRRSAEQLLAAAEHYAKQVGRRALPMPVPDDVDRMVRILTEVRDNLDVGVTLLLLPRNLSSTVLERDIWIGCTSFGLEYVSPGTFQWLCTLPQADIKGQSPMLEVAPLQDAGYFTLGAVKSGKSHEGFTAGFSIPLSPEPMLSAEAAFDLAALFEERYGCMALDEAQRRIGAQERTAMLDAVAQAHDALLSAGIRPGSAEATALFG